MTVLATWTYLALAAIVVSFQLAVAAGAPWGRLTQGGAHAGRLPAGGRFAAAASALLIAAFAVVVPARAGLLATPWPGAMRVLAWVVVGFGALTVLANGASRSRTERALWLPVGVVLLAASVVVARG